MDFYDDSASSNDGTNAPAAPQAPIHEWTEHEVHGFFASLGFPYYESQIEQHGLSGEILVHVDHEALKDVGIHSVGQRLAILKAVYLLKVRDDVPVEEGQWIPPSDDLEHVIAESPSGIIPPRKMVEMLGERDERIDLLEAQVKRLSASLEGYRDELSSIARAFYSHRDRSPAAGSFPSMTPTLPAGHGHSASLGTPRSTPMYPGRPADLPHTAELPRSAAASPLNSPRYPAPAQEINERLRPATSTSHTTSLFSSPLTPTQASTPTHSAPWSSHAHHVRNGNSPSTPTVGTPTASTSSFTKPGDPYGTNGASSAPNTALLSEPTSATPMTHAPIGVASEGGRSALPSTVTLVDDTAPYSQETLRGKVKVHGAGALEKMGDPFSPLSPSQDHKSPGANPLSSFKVTLEDPCYKVLPAALKKYKINDDWKLYALFLCYGNNVERCLALDERPLLLFQKLKDNDLNPVFMLRHIKDIRSPMSIAASKHASRRERRQREAEEMNLSDATGAASETTRAGAEVSPAKATRESEVGASAVPNTSPSPTFGVAVYPYFAERSDEMHVQLRDVFEVRAKAKGWWRVHRHRGPGSEPDAEYSDTPDHGWVPSGCLVEVSHLPASVTQPEDSKSIVHAPGSLLSQHVKGPALLDYRAQGDGESKLVKGETLAVYKRYSSWSYVVRTDGKRCEGGWCPAWMVGRGQKSSSTADNKT